MPRYMHAPRFAMPARPHTQTDTALAAVAAHRRIAFETKVARIVAGLVGVHGHPKPPEPYDGDPFTASARRLQRKAEAAGWEVRTRTDVVSVTVEGLRVRQGFRATWTRGRFAHASWHEPWRYAMVTDEREVKVSRRDGVGLKGFRSPGMGTTRLAIVASPRGIEIGFRELEGRIE